MAEGSQENLSAQIHNAKLKCLLRSGKLELTCDRATLVKVAKRNALPDHNQKIHRQSRQATIRRRRINEQDWIAQGSVVNHLANQKRISRDS